MADIFLAKRIGIGGFEKTLVIKRMLDSLAASPEFVGMFFDEARLAAKLEHPAIGQIQDFGAVGAAYFIAMEYIAGEDLRAIIARGAQVGRPVPVGVALRIALEVASGLEYAHGLSDGGQPLSIIHRDVSPSNIMVSYLGAVKLLDFGIAKAASRVSNTRTGTVKGKYSFLSPEQIRGQPIDGRADLFALGVSLHELFTHQKPFRRESELATIHAILNDPVPDACAARPDLPPEVARILGKLLARELVDRYASAAELRGDLQRAVALFGPGVGPPDLSRFIVDLFGKERMEERTHIPTVGQTSPVPVTPPRPVEAVPELPGTLEATHDLVVERPSRRRLLWWTGGGLTLATAAVSIALLLRPGPPDAPAPMPSPVAPFVPSGAALAPSSSPIAGAPAPAAADPLPPSALAPPPAPSPPGPGQPAEGRRAPGRPALPPAGPVVALDSATIEGVVRRSGTRFASCFRARQER
jgi:serine/threonine-protein kinase